MRWIVSGAFEVKTPIAVHTGRTEDDWPESDITDDINDPGPYDEKPTSAPPPILGIELDINGHPILPASAIKGLLRGLTAETVGTTTLDQVKRLFGDVPEDSASDPAKSPIGGILEVRAARLEHTASVRARPAIRGKTEIAEGTRTADDGQLRHDRIVAPGTRFGATFVLSGTQEDVAALLATLTMVDGNSRRSALGSSTTQGDGRLRWGSTHVRCFGPAEAKAWLESLDDRSWQTFAIDVDVAPLALDTDSGVVLDVPLTIEVDGHFLSSAWGREEGETKDGKIDTKPIRRPLRVGPDDTSARLPGSGLDGALRAQARRIFRTMAGDALPWERDDTSLPKAFGSLFGSASQASFLEVETLIDTSATLVRQEFVAIDRFSGGQAENKKFALEAFAEPSLTGRLRLRLSRRVNPALTGKQGVTGELSLEPAAVGLLALILKDLATGDIPLGHGTRKGYGGVRRLTSDSADWKGMLRVLGEGLVANADRVPGFHIFSGRTGEDALRHAVSLLQDEARAWAADRSPAIAGGSE